MRKKRKGKRRSKEKEVKVKRREKRKELEREDRGIPFLAGDEWVGRDSEISFVQLYNNLEREYRYRSSLHKGLEEDERELVLLQVVILSVCNMLLLFISVLLRVAVLLRVVALLQVVLQ
jgi:hypothetical protein